MNRRVTQLIQLVLAISLLAIPSSLIPVSAAMGACAYHSKMSCCGDDCCCPPQKFCAATSVPNTDRAVAQARPDVSTRVAIPLYSLPIEEKLLSSSSVSVAQMESKPPPLSLGSPPQSKLRVWIL